MIAPYLSHFQIIYSLRNIPDGITKNFVFTHDMNNEQSIVDLTLSFRDALTIAGYEEEDMSPFINLPALSDFEEAIGEDISEEEMERIIESSPPVSIDDEGLSPKIGKTSTKIEVTEENVEAFIKQINSDKELAERIFRRYAYDLNRG